MKRRTATTRKMCFATRIPVFRTYSNGNGLNSYYNSVHEVTDRSGAAALEYDEDVKVQLQAYNYGDWDLDGVTFLYTYAYGMKPVMNADGTLDTSEILAYTNTGDSKADTFSQIDGTYVTAEIIQKPGDKIRSILHQRQCGMRHRTQASQTVQTDTIPQRNTPRMW